MALTCARCGAQNPDGNAFCQACGTPLQAGGVTMAPPPSALPGPPVAYASPPQPAMGYQSPYYSPAAGGMQPPVHRTPWALIISAVVALILIMAGAGTAIAIIGAHSNNAASNNGLNSQLPTPSPAGTPTPIGSPTPIESGSTTSNDGLTMPLPSGWSVANKDTESITLVNPNGDGTVTAASGPSSPAMTAQANKDQIDKYFDSKYPDTKNCPSTQTTTGTLNGAPGIFWVLCFTLTSGNQSFPAAAALFAGANSDGSVYYIVMLVTPQDNLQSFEAASKAILLGIQWKLK